MRDEVKKAAIPVVAFDYQTLHGVALICEWLDAPTRYRRMKFECDDHSAPQALDDILGERADGMTDYLQIKYTPNPDKYLLSWDWLLAIDGGPRARCLLRKWFDALAQIEVTKRGRIALVTNRIPDLVIESCLINGHIEFARVDPITQGRVIDILGSRDAAVTFFEAMEISHSDKNFAHLDFHVHDRLSNHTDRSGAQRLVDAALRWARFKNQPAPDGWITLGEVEAEISRARPRPIPQDFAIPPDYVPPDAAFHEAMKRAILAAPAQPIVLAGPPGRGKSTYLSYLCEEMMREGTPVIRHHYFLSVADREDRLTSSAVIHSLRQQLQERFGNNSAVHRDTPVAHALAATAAAYKTKSQPLVIVLDGLDHVWREYHADKRPLDDVFAQLLPLPENVVLVVGTQPVADEQLPTRLLQTSPRGTWQVLPGMSPSAVARYLHKQTDGHRLTPSRDDALVESATDLHVLTRGHPLSVIYATEMLIASGGRLDAWAVSQLPTELGESTQRYYSMLWAKLRQPQRDILHLVSELELFWPASVFHTGALGITDDGTNLRGVSHLLHTAAAGLTVFHDSLRVFVNATDEHAARLPSLLSEVRTWLSTSAPARLRETWLWAVEARLGVSHHLVDGLRRDWILNRLVEGHGPTMPIGLLRQAEKIAFKARHFGSAYRLRHLKSRLDNGPKFAIEDITRLQFCSWALVAEQGVLDEATAGSGRLGMREEAALGLALHLRRHTTEASECIDHARRRHNADLRFLINRQRTEIDRDTRYLGYVLGVTNGIQPDEISDNHLLNRGGIRSLTDFLSGAAQSLNLTYIIAVRKQLKPQRRGLAETAAVRAAALAGARIEAWGDFSQFRGSALAACWAGLCGQPFELPANRIDTDWTDRSKPQGDSFLTVASEWFFKSVATVLASEGREFSWCPSPSSKARDAHEVSDYMDALTDCAEVACAAWRAGQPFGFDTFLAELEARHAPTGSNSWQRFGDPVLRRVTLHIALDCALVRAVVNGAPLIDISELDPNPPRKWVTWDQLVDVYNERQLRQLTGEAAARLFGHDEAQLRHLVLETNELVSRWLNLSEIACRHEMRKQTSIAVKTCWDFVLGYGHHKDPTIIETLQALDHLGAGASDVAIRLLRRMSAQVHFVTDYTDGDETRHAHSYANEILAQHDPHGLAMKCAMHIDEFDWSYADDALAARFRVAIDTTLIERIARTALPEEALQALKKRADARGASLYAAALSFLGVASSETPQVVAPVHSGSSNHNDDEPTQEPPDPSLYAPDRFGELRQHLRDLTFFGGYEYFPRWFAYWVSKGRKQELLESLRDIVLDDEVDRDVAYLLDPMFELSLELEGAAKAFRFVVAAQREMGGWGAYMEREEVTERRLKRVAKLYPSRAEEFLDQSCLPWLKRKRDADIVIPNDKLVFFLVTLGRVAEAVDLCESMVSSLEGDTRQLGLAQPAWGEALERDVWAGDLEFLVARMRWPAPSVRWWTATQLAELLFEESPNVGDRLRRRLRECRTETEVTDILAIFEMARGLGASIAMDLGNDIQLASPGSRIMLERMSISPAGSKSRPSARVTHPPTSATTASQGADIPAFWRTYVIGPLEESTGFPFRARFMTEWEDARALFPGGRLYPDHRYFFGPRLEQMSGFFVEPQEDRAHAAYMRTLHVAEQDWGAPQHFVENQVAEFERADTALSLLQPQSPDWLLAWDSGAAVTEQRVRDHVQRMLQHAAFSRAEVLAASLPVVRGENYALDLSVVLCNTGEESHEEIEPADAERVFHDLYGRVGAELRTSRPPTAGAIAIDPHEQALASVEPWRARCSAARVKWLPLRGHMQGELLLRGVLAPRSAVPLVGRIHSGSLRFFEGLQSIADFTYWTANWEPVFPTRVKPALGCALVSTHDAGGLKALQRGRRFYVWRCRSVQREHGYESFAEAEWFGILYLENRPSRSPGKDS